jgi:hypothetical protein
MRKEISSVFLCCCYNWRGEAEQLWLSSRVMCSRYEIHGVLLLPLYKYMLGKMMDIHAAFFKCPQMGARAPNISRTNTKNIPLIWRQLSQHNIWYTRTYYNPGGKLLTWPCSNLSSPFTLYDIRIRMASGFCMHIMIWITKNDQP